MWIRSQDRKTLVNADKFSVSKEHEVFRIYSVNYFLGEYSTEEKAMEVMNMIQRRIELAIKFYEISSVFSNESEYVFNMPKDDEVWILYSV